MDMKTDTTTLLNAEGNEPLVPGLDIIYNWRYAWMRAIAVAWENEEFKVRLLNNPKEALEELGFTGKSTSGNDKVDLYSLLDIKIEEAEANDNSHYQDKNGDLKGNGWLKAIENGELKMELTLKLPSAPKESQRAIALTEYDAAGKIYPFTGC